MQKVLKEGKKGGNFSVIHLGEKNAEFISLWPMDQADYMLEQCRITRISWRCLNAQLGTCL